MTLKELSQITGIPYDTLLRWNTAKIFKGQCD